MLDIKVGDYIEAKDGKHGYVTSLMNEIYGGFTWFCVTNYEEYVSVSSTDINKHFNRIGKYDFTKKDKIKPLEYCHTEKKRVDKIELKFDGIATVYNDESCDIVISTNKIEIIDKINEIIDYINKKDSQC